MMNITFVMVSGRREDAFLLHTLGAIHSPNTNTTGRRLSRPRRGIPIPLRTRFREDCPMILREGHNKRNKQRKRNSEGIFH